MKFRIALGLIFGTCYFLITGGLRVTESIRYHSPHSITFEKLITERPTVGWFTVTGGLVCFPGAVFAHSQQEMDAGTANQEMYCPVRDARLLTGEATDNGDTAQVVLKTNDPTLLSRVQSLRHLSADDINKRPDSDLFITGGVVAMVAAGTHSLDQEDEKSLRAGMPGLAPNCVILTACDKPSLLSALGMFAGGLALGVVLLCFLVKYGNT